ncbi:MAG: hypothetical protein KF893_21980 [Caldilineaceae bacterium]|nr:hypothetical protein [Caldilineaceae bacterium]
MFTDLFFYLRIAALGPQFASNPFLSAFVVGLLLRFPWIEGPQHIGVRRYLPRTVGFGVKWGVRILNGILILLQPVPGLGGLLLPLMCYTNYTVYRRAVEREGRRVLGAFTLASLPVSPTSESGSS